MKKIISTFLVSLVLAACSTTPSTDDTTMSSSSSSQTTTQQTQATPVDQQTLAQQQIEAFEANQVRMYTKPVSN